MAGSEKYEVSINFDNTALMKTTHEYILDYIQVIDRKASILLTILLAGLSLVGNGLRTGALQLNSLEAVAVGVSAFLAFIALILSAWVVYPRANFPDKEGYIYWEKILLFENEKDLFWDIRSTNEERALKELARDTFVISEIAANKYGWLRTAVKWSFLSGIVGMVAVINMIITEVHTFTSTFNQPPINERCAAIVSIVFPGLIFLIIISYISLGDNQVEDIDSFLSGQLSSLKGPAYRKDNF